MKITINIILSFLIFFLLFSDLKAQKFQTSLYVSPAYNKNIYDNFHYFKTFGFSLGVRESFKIKRLEAGISTEIAYLTSTIWGDARLKILNNHEHTEQKQSLFQLNIPVFLLINFNIKNKTGLYLFSSFGLSQIFYPFLKAYKVDLSQRNYKDGTIFYEKDNFLNKKTYLFTEFALGIHFKRIKLFIEPGYRIYFPEYEYTVDNYYYDGINEKPKTFSLKQNLIMLKIGYKF